MISIKTKDDKQNGHFKTKNQKFTSCKVILQDFGDC